MTENQKRRITLMRQNHIGYAAIANELKLPLSTVKAFCRRNSLQAGDLAGDTQIENKIWQVTHKSKINLHHRPILT